MYKFKLMQNLLLACWRRFTVGRFAQTPVKYTFSKNLRLVDYEGIFTKLKKIEGFPNIAPFFPNYIGLLITFVSGWFSAGSLTTFLTPFSKKKPCCEILISCLVCFDMPLNFEF